MKLQRRKAAEEGRRGQDGWFGGGQGGEQADNNTAFLLISVVVKPCSFSASAASFGNLALGCNPEHVWKCVSWKISFCA
jgi:hypothetical protein